jgi:DNA replication and repair protein RecF
VYCEHLSLVNFRNFARLELDLPTGLTVVLGDNAQGKSNLLEALYVMATTKSFRAGNDRDLINWRAAEEDMPFARVVARVRRDSRLVRLEIVVKEEKPALGTPPPTLSPLRGGAGNGSAPTSTVKRIKLNDIPKRALDVIGQVNVVMFSPQDIDVVVGPPMLRRRYLDITISQVDPPYCRSLAHYNRVLLQRNHLLRQLRERHASRDQLDFWNKEMIEAGSYVILKRMETIEEIDKMAGEMHRRLSKNKEALTVSYRSSLDVVDPETDAPRLREKLEPYTTAQSRLESIREVFQQRMADLQGKEIHYGVSLFGPHRDDLLFAVNDHDAAALGSRGQQRTVALSLKLAEADFMREKTGSYPIVLLDDVMSELDRSRRHQVLEMAMLSQQVLVTATDEYVFDPAALAQATILNVEQGVVDQPLAEDGSL